MQFLKWLDIILIFQFTKWPLKNLTCFYKSDRGFSFCVLLLTFPESQYTLWNWKWSLLVYYPFFFVGFSKFHMFVNLNLPRHLQCYLIVCVLNLAPFWFGGATRQMRKLYDIALPHIHAYRLQIKKFVQFKCAAIALALPDKACHTTLDALALPHRRCKVECQCERRSSTLIKKNTTQNTTKPT